MAQGGDLLNIYRLCKAARVELYHLLVVPFHQLPVHLWVHARVILHHVTLAPGNGLLSN